MPALTQCWVSNAHNSRWQWELIKHNQAMITIVSVSVMCLPGTYNTYTTHRMASDLRCRQLNDCCESCMHCSVHKKTTKDRKGALHRTAKDPQRTSKEHYGLGCRKLAPTEINGALYSNARQDSSKLADSLQCLFCACLIVTSRWFALSKFVSYEMKITVMLLALLLLLPIEKIKYSMK